MKHSGVEPEPLTSPGKELRTAIRAGDVPRVIALLRSVSPNENDGSGACLPLTESLTCSYVRAGVRADIVRILLLAGADPMLEDPSFKCNAMILAANRTEPQLDLLDLIFEYSAGKADPNQPDADGKLPLQCCNYEPGMRQLIAHGADVLLPNASGQNTLDSYRANKSHLLSAALWDGVIAPHLKDGKLDLNTLIDDDKPTPTMKILLEYGIPLGISDPATYQNGMDDLAVVYDHLPLSLKHYIDLSGYHEKLVENSADQTHIGRYERKKPTTERGRL